MSLCHISCGSDLCPQSKVKVMEVAVPPLCDPLLHNRHLAVLALHMDMVDCISASTIHTCRRRPAGSLQCMNITCVYIGNFTVCWDGGADCKQASRALRFLYFLYVPRFSLLHRNRT